MFLNLFRYVCIFIYSIYHLRCIHLYFGCQSVQCFNGIDCIILNNLRKRSISIFAEKKINRCFKKKGLFKRYYPNTKVKMFFSISHHEHHILRMVCVDKNSSNSKISLFSSNLSRCWTQLHVLSKLFLNPCCQLSVNLLHIHVSSFSYLYILFKSYELCIHGEKLFMRTWCCKWLKWKTDEYDKFNDLLLFFAVLLPTLQY